MRTRPESAAGQWHEVGWGTVRHVTVTVIALLNIDTSVDGFDPYSPVHENSLQRHRGGRDGEGGGGGGLLEGRKGVERVQS